MAGVTGLHESLLRQGTRCGGSDKPGSFITTCLSSRQPTSLVAGHRSIDNTKVHEIMPADYFLERNGSGLQEGLSPASPAVGTPGTRGTSALSSRITSVLSASYADLDIRDAVETLDARGVQNTAETRRQLRLDVQREVIECNGEIVKDFGEVAEVCKQTLDTWPQTE